jgi:hypothetical protein
LLPSDRPKDRHSRPFAPHPFRVGTPKPFRRFLMYYNRLAQTRRVGQRISARSAEEQVTPREIGTDFFEFGSEQEVDDSITELELCKGLMYPVD